MDSFGLLARRMLGQLKRLSQIYTSDDLVKPFVINSELLESEREEVELHDGRPYPWGTFSHAPIVCLHCGHKNTYNVKICLHCKNQLPQEQEQTESLRFLEPIYPYGHSERSKKKGIQGVLIQL